MAEVKSYSDESVTQSDSSDSINYIDLSLNVTSDSLVAVCPIPKGNTSNTLTNSAYLKIIYTNVDTLKNKMEELETIICNQKPDIISLVEIFPKYSNFQYIPSEYTIEGYSMFLSDFGKRGTALYIKDDLRASTSAMAEFVFEESTWCEVNLRGGDKLLLGSVYRSPNSSSTNNCNLLQMFEEIEKIAPSHLLIMGDFNYKEINWEDRTCHSGLLSDPYKLLDKVTTLRWTQHITTSTRHRQGQQSSLLDLK